MAKIEGKDTYKGNGEVMRALSLKQPWASMIFQGKDIENRNWFTKYRGPLLIHASKSIDAEGYQWIWKNIDRLDLPFLPALKRLPIGAILGSVTIIDCVKAHHSPWFFGPYGFVFAKPKEFEMPIPYKGKLGIFNVDVPLTQGIEKAERMEKSGQESCTNK